MQKIKPILLVIAIGIGVAIFLLLVSPKEGGLQKAVDIPPSLPVPSGAFTHDPGTEIVFVPRVIDGDTIEVEAVNSLTGIPGRKETVRYIGMDTPETVHPNKPIECFGHEASARNKALVEGRYVAIRKDVSDHDKYGRLLRFVYLLDISSGTASASATLGTFVDVALVRDGYARVLTIPPDVLYADVFRTAEQSAQDAKLGFWGACSSYPFL